MQDWQGSVAFITGGGQGIGLGIARALAHRGVRLALADVDEVALARGREELSAATDVETVRLDVRDREEYAAVADRVEARLGSVDLLVNNAGVAPFSRLPELTYEKWDLTLGVNLGGVVNGIQTFLPRMIERGRGYVVNTASGAGLVSGSNVLYGTGKHAVVGLSEALRSAAREHGIGVSVLCPAFVDTGILESTGVAGGGSLAFPPGSTDEARASLAAGVGIDAVGEMVVAGVENRAMWICTDGDLRAPVTARMEALLASIREAS